MATTGVGCRPAACCRWTRQPWRWSVRLSSVGSWWWSSGVGSSWLSVGWWWLSVGWWSLWSVGVGCGAVVGWLSVGSWVVVVGRAVVDVAMSSSRLRSDAMLREAFAGRAGIATGVVVVSRADRPVRWWGWWWGFVGVWRGWWWLVVAWVRWWVGSVVWFGGGGVGGAVASVVPMARHTALTTGGYRRCSLRVE